ncbi:hypothetical protein BJX61DRAFT_542677 [Aspergillus egyptiacus]|nr:hypothetical protein BJX61DRAFT_542677 [Aspergillus egyptiacus]
MTLLDPGRKLFPSNLGFHRQLVPTRAVGRRADAVWLSAELSATVLERLGKKHDDDGGGSSNTACMILPSAPAAQRLITTLTGRNTSHHASVSPYIRFGVPAGNDDDDGSSASRWATFFAVLYHTDLAPDAMAFWRETGDGISSRHAEFALAWFPYLESQCVDRRFCTNARLPLHRAALPALPSLPSRATTATEVAVIKALLAASAASDAPDQAPISPKDIFLYQKGLCGIYAVARSLVPENSSAKTSQVVIYGAIWLDGHTPRRSSAWSAVDGDE